MTEIYLTNMAGMRVLDIYNSDIAEANEYKFNVNTNHISSGMYYIVLQTPTIRKLEKIIIEK